jgi:hypothetical protein
VGYAGGSVAHTVMLPAPSLLPTPRGTRYWGDVEWGAAGTSAPIIVWQDTGYKNHIMLPITFPATSSNAF